jgi:hypothetical protein
MERGSCSVHDALKVVAGGLADWSSNVLDDLGKREKEGENGAGKMQAWWVKW